MAKKSRKKSSFRGKVKSNATTRASKGNNYGYLRLPKGVSVFSPTPGAREKFDILPYEVTMPNHPDKDSEIGIAEKGDMWYKRPFRIHRNVGTDKDSVVCLSSFGKKCPICEYRAKRAKEGAEKEELKEYNSSQRNLYLIVPRGVKKVEEEIHVFDFSDFLFQALLDEEVGENEEFETFPDLEEGYTLKVRWNEEQFAGNSFAKAGRIDFVSRDISDEDLNDSIDLDAMLIELSYDEINAKFFEMETDSDDDTDSSDEDEDEEEVEVEEKPKRKKKKVVEEVEEDEDEEEEPTDLEWKDIEGLGEDEMEELIDEKELDIDMDDYGDENELLQAIAEELDIDVPKSFLVKKEKASKKAKEEKKPEKKSKKEKPAKKEKASDGGCPHGYKFGKDTDAKDECDECDAWSDCIDEKEK